jgi:hypothetical protein
MSATSLLVWGATIHLVVDWLGQNQWMALNKGRLDHPAAYVHAGVHGLAMLLVFPPLAAAALGLVHLLIDTRRPLDWWSRVMRQTPEGPEGFTIHVFRDQALHLGTVAIAALIVAG